MNNTQNTQGQASIKSSNLSEILGAESDSSKSKDLLFLKKKLEKIMYAIDNLEIARDDQKRAENENLNEYKDKVLKNIESQIHNARETIQCDVNKTFNEFGEKLVEVMVEVKTMKIGLTGENYDPSRKPKVFSEKSFSHHDSLLTILFRSKEEFKTLYHLALASMILLMIDLILHDYTEYGTLIDMNTFFWCFYNYEVVMKAWLFMMIYSFAIIIIVQVIKTGNLSSKIWIPFYSIFLCSFFIYSTYITLAYELNFGSAMIILCESTRCSFKCHSYLRNKLLYGLPNQYATYLSEEAIKRGITEKDINIPTITIEDFWAELHRYFYFFFCPTLVYRDEYPKRSTRNIKFILFNGFNCALSIYYIFILLKTFIKPEFSHSGEKPGTLGDFLISIFKSTLPGTFCLLLLFYGLLHSWFNFWAEMLRFPDRLFYEDWWNSLEFGTYYRKWNIVVHEFLYYYVYMDILKFFKGKISRNTSQLLTFLISAVIHEWILTYAIGFFYPMLFILFTGPGIFLIRNTKNQKSKQFNIAFWILLFFGNGLLMVLYSREFYARTIYNQKDVENEYGWFARFMPRTLFAVLQNKA